MFEVGVGKHMDLNVIPEPLNQKVIAFFFGLE